MNSWLGPDVIKSDNKPQNQNGKMLVNFVKKNQLTIVNPLSLCKGTTTWTRTRLGVKLTSPLDFFIVCARDLPFVKEMVINSDSRHKITNFKNTKKPTESDHGTKWLKLSLKISPPKTENTIILNFKDIVGQQKLKENTSNTTEFTDRLIGYEKFHKQMDNWKHLLEKHCNRAFPKIGILKVSLKPSKADKLINLRSNMLKSKHKYNHDDLEDLNVKIVNTIAIKERHMMKMFCNPSGYINVSEMWKVKKKLWSNKASSLPTVKLNPHGLLVSTASEINETMMKEYTKRLRENPLHPLMKKLYKAKTIHYKLKISKKNKSPLITMNELEYVLKTSKTGKV